MKTLAKVLVRRENRWNKIRAKEERKKET